MNKTLICVMLLALPVSALATVVDYFPVTLDGSWHAAEPQGYGQMGDGNFRLTRGNNQNMGFMDWAGSLGDNTGQSLADFITTGSGLQGARLYLRMVDPMGGNVIRLVTLRSGNPGDITEGDHDVRGATYIDPDDDLVPWPVAWEPGWPPYDFKGDFNYSLALPLPGDGVAWITPSTRSHGMANYPGGKPIGPSEPVVFGPNNDSGWDDVGDTWALQYLLGFHWSQGGSTVARMLMAGQLVNSENLSAAGGVGTNEPRDRAGDASDNWFKVEMDLDIVADIAGFVENKGIAFTAYGNDCNFDWTAGNARVWASDQTGGIYGAYLEVWVPEPASLALLALGGLVAVRRRR